MNRNGTTLDRIIREMNLRKRVGGQMMLGGLHVYYDFKWGKCDRA